ncbi:TetR/AcrR family transcriptional regulator [Pseudoteredinibacter isoporae]|uniref:AcrR family transcriptional regulator n=1 Tax=Pseudoteredinibacter isoporae TaxID=570281 RepID=A0A7X0JV28_9GAMM|nr:TetR/AcrR family transcriptional regulator [Pseudoteredinibacter isoporae]MBB6522815.1 AcrR family transcriptional regulator [Pseudoteredinibacter isoporae]NHO88342.1 TetR/AcrR family transcriptional regulator [Pseudoteredinibacter isoporae]NIB23327.1 TetR/AcrR family transcriptional regulator [Pseudoteredinibacter isoporae]
MVDQTEPSKTGEDGADRRLISAEALEKLRNVLIHLFSEGMFHEVGIRDICTQAKVSPKTVYKYFGNKEQLLAACVEQDLQALAELTAEKVDEMSSVKDKIRAQVDVILGFYQQRPAVARMVFLNIPIVYWLQSASPAHYQHRQIGREVYKLAIEQNLIKPGLQEDVVSEMIAGGINRVISSCLYEDKADRMSEYADGCFEFIWAALSRNET